MILDEFNIVTKDEVNNCIGEIVREGLEDPIVRRVCSLNGKTKYEETKKIDLEFCRFIGYCILFRSSQNVGEYMSISNREEQIKFIINKISKELNISREEINYRKKQIIEYIYERFKKKGFVFHAANSKSVKTKMEFGLSDNMTNLEQKNELLYIEKIYRKYAADNQYSPLGHAATDILEQKTGWFFDGFPIHSMGYANSPQWFSYFCGKSYVYFDSIPEEKRYGYANKDYKTARDAIIWLIKDRKMEVEDARIIIQFFKKWWDEYKDTTPCLMFIPVEEVGVNDDIKLEQYLSKEGIDLLFDEILLGKVNSGKNYCCKKIIKPDKLSYTDLSPILPKFIVNRENRNIYSNNHDDDAR